MEFQQLMIRRRSIRGFRPDGVPRDLLERVLAAAARAPSWCNVQGWHVALTAGRATEALRRDLLARVDNPHAAPQPELDWIWQYEEPYLSRRRDCARALYDCLGIAYRDKPARAKAMMRNFEFFGAPHVAVLSAPRSLGAYGLVDVGCFLQSFLLSLTDHGLAGCPQASVTSYAPLLREHLPIPESNRIVCAVSLGYEDTGDPVNRTATDRIPVGEFTAWKGFD